VNTTVIHNTYVNNVTVNNVTVNRTSFNGPGGVAAQPTAAERQAASEPHTPPTAAQVSHVHEAVRNPQLSAKANGGKPPIAATARPAAFNKEGIVPAKGAPPLKPIVPAAHTPATGPASHEPVNAAHPEPPKAPVEPAKQPIPAAKPPVNNTVHAPAAQTTHAPAAQTSHPAPARPQAAPARPAAKAPAPAAKKAPPARKEGEKP
jgi:hypothetical protein